MLNTDVPLKDKRLRNIFRNIFKNFNLTIKQILEKWYLVEQHNSLAWWDLLQVRDYKNFSLQHVELEVEFSLAWLGQFLLQGMKEEGEIRKQEYALKQALTGSSQFSQKIEIIKIQNWPSLCQMNGK